MAKAVNRHTPSLGAFVYFSFLWAVMGIGVGFFLAAPLFVLGWFFPKAHRWGAFCIHQTVRRFIVGPVFKIDARFHGFYGTTPCFTVSNHRSNLDAFVLLSHIQGLRILAKQSLFWVPFLGWVMKLMGQIPIRPSGVNEYREAFAEVKSALEQGDPVHIFPEMTRCPLGFRGTQRFHLMPFQVAIELKIRIVPVAFFNTDRAWPKGSSKMDRSVVVTAEALEPVDASVYLDSETLKNEVQRRINAALERGATA